jgi:MFS family permease
MSERKPANWRIQYALLAGPLLSMLDSSIVNVAVEPIARELHASLTAVQWAVSGYLLALGAGLAGTAYLARRGGLAQHLLINVPLGAVAALTVRLVPPRLAPGRERGARFDLPGLLLLAAGMTGLLFGASQGATVGWSAASTAAPLAAGGALVAGLGLLLIGATTPLWLIALILAGRSAAVGLVITPLLQALTQGLRPARLGDANTLFNACQRVASSFGIGLVASLYAAQARQYGAVPALHLAGLVIAAVSLAGAIGAVALPAMHNTSPARLPPPGLAALLSHAGGGLGQGRGTRAEVVQVFPDPQQMRVMVRPL